MAMMNATIMTASSAESPATRKLLAEPSRRPGNLPGNLHRRRIGFTVLHDMRWRARESEDGDALPFLVPLTDAASHYRFHPGHSPPRRWFAYLVRCPPDSRSSDGDTGHWGHRPRPLGQD